MGFTRTWSEYTLFSFWGILFLTAGWLTVTLFIGSLGKRLSADRLVKNAPPRKREESAFSIDHGEFTFFEWVLLCVLAGLTVTSFILLLTAELGIFRIRFWILSLIVYDLSLLALLLGSKKPFRFSTLLSGFKFHGSDILAILCAILTFVVLNRPAQYVLTNRDPGEYVSVALQLADSGSLRIKDADFIHFNTPEKEILFLKTPLQDAPHPEVLPGFYLVDPLNGFLLPQYFHLFPLWLALAFKLWRFEGLFLFNVICGALGVLLLIPLGRWLLNSRTTGFAASLLLMVNAGQIWMSRSPFSEILAQVLLLGGLWFLAVGMKRYFRGAFFLAALMFGLCFFVRIDSLLLLVAIAILGGRWVLTSPWAADKEGNDRDWYNAPFFIVVASCAFYSFLHTALFAYPYFSNILSTFRKSPFVLIITGIFIVAASVLGGVGWRFLKGNPRRDWIGTNRTVIKRIGVVLLLGVFAYGLFIRPSLPSSREIVDLPPPYEGKISLYNEINLVRLSWFLTPLGLGLALLGALVVLNDVFERKNAILIPFILVFTVYSGFYLYKSRAFPDNYWVIRRYIEIVIPGCLLLTVVFLSWLYSILKKKYSTTGTSAVCLLLFLLVWVGEFRAVPNLWSQTELGGTIQNLGKLAGMLKEADIVILEYSRSQDTFSGPLKSVFHKSVYALATFEPDPNAFDGLMDQWLRQGKRVFILATDEETRLQSSRFHFILKDRFSFRTLRIEQTYERLPRSLETVSFFATIYEVEWSPHKDKLEQVTFDMDFHFGVRNTGFNSAESAGEGESIRWSSAHSTIELPAIDPEGETIFLMSARQEFPDGRSALPLEIYLNDMLLGHCALSPEPKVYRFKIPAGLVTKGKANQVRFHSDTFSPAAWGISPDTRQLGFILDYLKLGSFSEPGMKSGFFVDLGTASDVQQCLLEGFYERVQGAYRWTAPEAILTISPPLAYVSGQSIRIRTVKSCPVGEFKQFLNVTLNGVTLGQRELVGVGDQFSVIEFPIAQVPQAPGATSIRISVVPPWNPNKAGVSVDRRTLGCAIDWVKID